MQYLCASRVECGRCCHCLTSPTSFRRLLVLAMSGNRGAKSNALLHGRHCLLYATTFHAATKDRECGTSKVYPASDLLGALAVCDGHLAEVFESFQILQGLTIKKDSLARSPGMSADITLVFEALMRMPTVAAWRLTASSSPCISL